MSTIFNTQNCTNIPTTTATDAGVAGAGVLLSFIITALLALLTSAMIVVLSLRRNNESRILRKLLQSFSDQQIITGIGIQSVGLAKMSTMVSYHFFIIWMLSLLSTATHLSTLLALVNDFKRDWVLRWLRKLMMFINMILSCVYGVNVLRAVMKDLPATLPIACVWNLPSHSAASNAGVSVAGTIAVIAGNCIVFAFSVWYIHSKNQRWLKVVQIAGLLFVFGAAAGAAVRVVLLSQAFGTPNVPLEGTGEKDWSFGQLLPILLLLLPLVSAVEMFRGEMNTPAPVCENQNIKYEDHEMFQPNPFWGLKANLDRNR